MEKRGVMFALAIEFVLLLILIIVKESMFGYSNRTVVLLLASLILGGALTIFYLNNLTKISIVPHWIINACGIILLFVFVTELAGYVLEIITTIALILCGVAFFFIIPEHIKKEKVVHKHTKEVIHKKPKNAKLIGSTNGKKAHFSTCIVAKRIPKEKMLVFKDKNDALDAGYKLCELCVHKEEN